MVRMNLVAHLLMKKVMTVKVVVAVVATLKIVLLAVVTMKKVFHRAQQRIKRKNPRKQNKIKSLMRRVKKKIR